MDGYDGYNKVTCGTVTCTNLQNQIKRNGSGDKTPMTKRQYKKRPNPKPKIKHKSVTFHTLAFCLWHSHRIPEKWYEIIILVLMDSMCIVMDSCLAVEIRVKKLPEQTEHSISQRKTRSYTVNI